MKLVAAVVLAAVLTRHYGWGFVSPESAGVVSKMMGAIASIVFLALIAAAWKRSRIVMLACAYGAWEYGQTALCSAAYLVKPWPVAEGQAMCSAWVGWDVGFVGLLFAAYVAHEASYQS